MLRDHNDHDLRDRIRRRGGESAAHVGLRGLDFCLTNVRHLQCSLKQTEGINYFLHKHLLIANNK